MKRYGSGHTQMRKTTKEDVFLLHLQLMIVVVKAALKGYPIGDYRKRAALENAHLVHKLISTLDVTFLDLKTSSHLFRERVKLLSVMATAIVSETYPLGIYRRQAVLENIDIIHEYAFPQKKMKLFHDVLKVA